MGRENTIRTGSTVVKGLARGGYGSNNAFLLDKTLPNSPFDYGVVEFVDTGSQAITFTPLEDNIVYKRQGQALPLHRGTTNIPQKGNVVPLLRAPEFIGGQTANSLGDRNNKITYYLDPIQVDVNSNQVNINPTNPNSNLPSSTTAFTNKEQQDNMLFVKNYCKQKGLSKEATAGIMGNIMRECSFKPTKPFNDVNGKKSYGLIQWNACCYDLTKIGPTVEEQMNLLFDVNFTGSMKDYLDFIKNNPSTDAWTTAYNFARIVEKCSFCTSGEDAYRNGGIATNKETGQQYQVQPVLRSQYALDYMNRFNNPNDSLAW